MKMYQIMETSNTTLRYASNIHLLETLKLFTYILQYKSAATDNKLKFTASHSRHAGLTYRT